MNKIIILLICIGSFITYSYGQIIKDSVLWITLPSDVVVHDSSYTSDNRINEILIRHKVSNIAPVFPFAKSEFLRNTYQVNCNSAEELYNDILKNTNIFTYCDYVYEEIPSYDPPDWMWYNTVTNNITNDWLWYLVKINASQAWDITRGDPNIKIAVVDVGNVDYNHPELISKIDPPYDFYPNISTYTPPAQHPTIVSSLLAAETADIGETPQGSMASIGYKSKIMYSRGGLPACLYASTVLGAEILSISWSNSCTPTNYNLEVEEEILGNGTLIIRAAGNGPTYCNGGRLYPFSGYEDDRVIVVSSTDFNDNHTNGNGTTHSHYAEVDICAPGYSVMGATESIDANGQPVSWPYYGFCNGTSFATPIVAGVAALIKSVNRCLSSTDIQHIIKTTADPIADANLYPGLVGAGRINAYQALLMAKSYSDTVHISSNTTWASERKVHGHIVIDSLATLTVTDTLKLGKDVKIIIKPAGKLVVDGGVITNLCCDDMWDGIYIVGDSTKRQLAKYQGTLVVKNGSLIENAKVAVSTWDGIDETTSGGIIQCTNSTFYNNGRSINIYRYTNHYASGYETDNVSFVNACTFIVDDDNLFLSNIEDFETFVWLSHIKGVQFKGCTFRDARTTANDQTKGIQSEGAGFIVSDLCSMPYNSNAPCNCPGIETRTKFSRLGFGIWAGNSGSVNKFVASNIIFDTCYNAIYMSALNNCSITRSNIDMSTSSTFSNGSAVGIYANNSSGYTIEGNVIGSGYTVQPSGYTGRGIYVRNSGTDANSVYRNTISNVTQGIYTLETNSGLQLQCNEFTDNFFSDISIFNSISGSQGSSTKSAGNKFNSGVKKIHSSSTYLTYYHSGANNSSNEYCPNNSSPTVTRVANITANNCTPTICLPINPPGPKSAPENDDISLYESLQQMYNARLAEYNAAGYGFLLHNFDENDADIVAIARQKQDTLITISRAMAEIANRNINAILGDSILDRESLNGWYNRINTTTAKYSLVNSYFETGNYSLANQELASIPQRFALSSEELAEYNNFCDYNALRESVYTSGRNYAQLTADEIAELEDIADLNTGVSSAYANSVLCFFYGICREIEEPEMDDTPVNNKNAVASIDENAEPESLAVYVYPNPADEELNILLNLLPKGATTIEFHDVTGRLVLSEEIKSANTSINISSLRQGVYMYRILNGDNVIARDRIVKE